MLIDPHIKVTILQDGQRDRRTITSEPSPIVQAQQTLKSLCLVSKKWNLEARKYLWSSGIQFGLPRSFESVVKIVDPVGFFFDGGVEPTWLMSPPASRHSSPMRQIFTADQPVSVSSHNHNKPEHSQARNRSVGSGRRSVSLKRQGGNYILQPHSATESSHHSKTDATPFIRDQASVRDEDYSPECERTISPIRTTIAVPSLSQAFRRTSVSPSHIRSGHAASLMGRLQEDEEKWTPVKPVAQDDQEDDEFIFDHHIDDLFNPAPYITSVSFSKYRSHGMRRSVAEGRQARFVTPERLMRLLRSTRSRYSGLFDDSTDTTVELKLESGKNLLLRKGKLEAVGFSEYMDSAITKSVLDEILLRGGIEVEYQVIKPDYRSEAVGSTVENDDRGRARSRKELSTASHCAGPHHTLPAPVEEVSRTYGSASPTLTVSPMRSDSRSSCPFTIETRLESNLLTETPIKALDLCGCISATVQTAIKDFIVHHALASPYHADRGAPDVITLPNTPTGLLRSTRFPHLTRVGLSRMIILDDLELSDFLVGFVNLLDLDLSYTRAGPHVLHTLQLMKQNDGCRSRFSQPRPSFRSLNLAKCRGLTKESLVGFLCGDQDDEGTDQLERWEDPVQSIGDLEELSLYGDLTQPTPLDSEALDKILTSCPALRSGRLTTLDLSSILIDDSEYDLKARMPRQPRLLQFGIGSCPRISLATIADLLKNKMSSVEVIDISSSCSSARHLRSSFRPSLPVISVGQLHSELINPVVRLKEGGRRMTNLRVIELEDASLQAIAGGTGGWKVAFGKGQRGWYVDLSATVVITRNLPTTYKRLICSRQVADCSLTGANDLVEILKRHNLELMDANIEQKVGHLEDSLKALKDADETIRHTEIGWMSRKTESKRVRIDPGLNQSADSFSKKKNPQFYMAPDCWGDKTACMAFMHLQVSNSYYICNLAIAPSASEVGNIEFGGRWVLFIYE